MESAPVGVRSFERPEAGHAIIGQQLGIHIKSVSIVPDQGPCRWYRGSPGISFLRSDTVAGLLAKKRWRPVSGRGGRGKSDYAVWRPSSGVWYTQFSNGGTSSVGWGVNGDKAIGRVPGS